MEFLKVHQFGPIGDIDITLKKVNIFIGEQGVGKSTLAKLLSCCRDYFLYYLILHEKDSNLISQVFSSYGIHTYFKPETRIEYSNKDGWRLCYSHGSFTIENQNHTSDEAVQMVDRMVVEGIQKASGQLTYPGKELSNDYLTRILQDNSRLIISNLRSSFYCPAERGIAAVLSNSLASIFISNVPLPQPLLEYMSFFEKARQEYESFEIPFIHLAYTYEDGKDMVQVDGSTVQLRYASSGIQSILPLMMVIDFCLQKNYFYSFTIEEPELNLFPTNQLHLIQSLISKTNKESSRLGNWTLTTHSPYLLSVFNISLLAGRIAERFPDHSDAIKEIMPMDYLIHPDEVSVYELTHKDKEGAYCVNIHDESTGLIKENYLDSVSDIISTDFNRLYKLYIRLSKSTANKK